MIAHAHRWKNSSFYSHVWQSQIALIKNEAHLKGSHDDKNTCINFMNTQITLCQHDVESSM